MNQELVEHIDKGKEKEYIEVRCPNDHRLFFKAKRPLKLGHLIEYKCPRCGKIFDIRTAIVYNIIEKKTS